MLKCVLGAAVLVAAAGVANAGFTPVNTGGTFGGGAGTPSGEGRPGPTSIVNIMAAIYLGGGTNFSTVNVSGNVNGALTFGTNLPINQQFTATRVHDWIGTPGTAGTDLNIGTGNVAGNTDRVFTDGTASFRARAKYAGFNQYVGVRNGTGAGGFSTVGPGSFTSLNVPASGGTINLGPGPSIFVGPGQFQFMRANNATGTNNPSYSNSSNNTGGVDQMVMFQITGPGIHLPRYIIAFEDVNSGDRDFNDLLLEIQTIPLPTGAGLALAGMGIVGGIRRRRVVG
jgi:hypothetical protein